MEDLTDAAIGDIVRFCAEMDDRGEYGLKEWHRFVVFHHLLQQMFVVKDGDDLAMVGFAWRLSTLERDFDVWPESTMEAGEYAYVPFIVIAEGRPMRELFGVFIEWIYKRYPGIKSIAFHRRKTGEKLHIYGLRSETWEDQEHLLLQT